MRHSLTRYCCVLTASLGLLAASSARAADGAFEPGHKPISDVGAALASSLYFPAKVAFAVGGAVVSGITYVATLGNPEPTREIWTASVEGDYVVTPSMIEGHEDLDFVGG